MAAHDDDALTDRDDDVSDELADRESRPVVGTEEGVRYPTGLTIGDVLDVGRRPVSCAVRVTSRNEGHTTVTVWAGRNEGARGNSGKLVFRTDEWYELVNREGSIKGGRLVIEFDVLDGPLD